MTLLELLLGCIGYYFSLFFGAATQAISHVILNISTSALTAIPALAVALLLPLAIFLIESGGAYPFDKKLILSDIIHFKPLMALIILESLVLCVVDSHIAFKILATIVDAFLIVIIIDTIHKFYNWVCTSSDKNSKTSFRQSLRLQYLNSIANPDELYEVWTQILNNAAMRQEDKQNNAQPGQNSLPDNQVGFVDALLYALRKLEQATEGDPDAMKYTTLVNLVAQNYDKLTFDNVNQYRAFVRYATEFARHQCNYDQADDPNSHELFLSSSKFQLTKVILHSIVITDPVYFRGYAVFDEIEQTMNGMQDEEELYTFQVMLFGELFKLFDKDQHKVSYFWGHVPLLRKINFTKENLTKQAGILTAYRVYLREAIGSTLDSDKPEAGQALNLISMHLFGDLDLIFWFDIVTFIETPGMGADFESAQRQRIKTWCQLKRKRHFGRLSRLYATSMRHDPNLTDKERMERFAQIDEQLNNRGQQNAMEILYTCYRGIMNRDYLNKVRNITASIITDEKSEDAKRQEGPSKVAAWQHDDTFHGLEELLETFREMLVFIDQREGNK